MIIRDRNALEYDINNFEDCFRQEILLFQIFHD